MSSSGLRLIVGLAWLVLVACTPEPEPKFMVARPSDHTRFEADLQIRRIRDRCIDRAREGGHCQLHYALTATNVGSSPGDVLCFVRLVDDGGRTVGTTEIVGFLVGPGQTVSHRGHAAITGVPVDYRSKCHAYEPDTLESG